MPFLIYLTGVRRDPHTRNTDMLFKIHILDFILTCRLTSSYNTAYIDPSHCCVKAHLKTPGDTQMNAEMSTLAPGTLSWSQLLQVVQLMTSSIIIIEKCDTSN